MMLRLVLTILCASLAGCATVPQIAPGARYVALGSSYAAGPGIAPVEAPVTRCARSLEDYPHQVARALRLALVDVTCSGATTAHVLGPWDELPAQLEAVTAATRLVTVTIGGNDLGYYGALAASACIGPACPAVRLPGAADYAAVEAAMGRIGAEVRRRAAGARLIFVDYPAVLPARGTCAAVAMTAAQADAIRVVAVRLAAATARAAKAAGAQVLRASALTRDHGACATVPWMNGAQAAVPFHPNVAGATGVATALVRRIGAGGG